MKMRMKGGDRRAAIIRSAIHLFAEKGFRGATTRELASAAGVSEPVLYQHFRTKRSLYNAIVEAEAARISGRTAELRALLESGDDRAFFRAIGETILARYRDEPEMPRLLLFSCLERHELSELFFERLSLGLQKLLAAYIRRRTREGAFRKVNPDIAARGLIGMVSQHALACLLLPGRFASPDRRVVEQMVGIFLAGIEVQASAS